MSDEDRFRPFRKAARRHGAVLNPGASMTLRLHERPAVVEELQFSSSDTPSYATRIVVDLRGCSPGTLKIFPEGFFSPVAKLFGAQDVRIGDAAFDALYLVKSTPEALAAAVFGAPRRPQLIAALRAVGRYLGPVIDLGRDGLRIQVAQDVSEQLIDRLVDAAGELVFAVLACATGGATLWELTQAVGRCPVCGTPLREGLLRCGTCRTPHHRECWDYAGGCSTYACGSKRSS